MAARTSSERQASRTAWPRQHERRRKWQRAVPSRWSWVCGWRSGDGGRGLSVSRRLRSWPVIVFLELQRDGNADWLVVDERQLRLSSSWSTPVEAGRDKRKTERCEKQHSHRGLQILGSLTWRTEKWLLTDAGDVSPLQLQACPHTPVLVCGAANFHSRSPL